MRLSLDRYMEGILEHEPGTEKKHIESKRLRQIRILACRLGKLDSAAYFCVSVETLLRMGEYFSTNDTSKLAMPKL